MEQTAPPRETPTTRYWLDAEGVLRAQALDGSEETGAHAREGIRILAELGGGVRRPILVDISRLRSITREARSVYTSKEALAVYSAVAMVVASPISRAIGNFFLGLNRPPVPMRLVNKVDEGLAWLRQQGPAR